VFGGSLYVLIFRKSLSIYCLFMKKSGFRKETFLNRNFHQKLSLNSSKFWAQVSLFYVEV
jgi:hypothetical protein